MSEHFGAPQPQEEKDSYGTPIGNPVGPTNPTAPSIDFNQPSFSSEVNNPFTQPPYQTTFTATPSVTIKHFTQIHLISIQSLFVPIFYVQLMILTHI